MIQRIVLQGTRARTGSIHEVPLETSIMRFQCKYMERIHFQTNTGE
jgi:hypothetical protein